MHAPSFDAETAAAMAAEHFGIRGAARQLPSERDQNFLITNSAGEKFVLKIANALEEPAFVEAQNAVLKHLANRISFCQRLVLTSSGEEMVTVPGLDGARHLVRMVHYIDGVPLARVHPQPPELLRGLGRKLGQLDRALADFDHPAAHRDFHWDLANGNRILEEYGQFIDDPELRELARKHRVTFDSELRRSVIHGDANDYNVLVDRERMEVVGIIDFGDMVYSYTVGNLAVAIAYVALKNFREGVVAKEVMKGYWAEFPLTRRELAMVRPLVLTRWLVSFCLSAYQQQQRPDNKYLGISQRAIRSILSKLLNADRRG